MLTPLESDNSFPKSVFRKYLELEPLRPRTIELYLSLYGPISELFGSLASPDMDTIKKYMKTHPRPYHFAALYYYCHARYGLSIQRPGRNYKTPDPKPNDSPSYETFEAAYNKICARLGEAEKTIIKLRVYSGRRISEVLMLKVSQINFEKDSILFEIKGHGGKVKYSTTRMSPEIKEMLKTYIKTNELLGGEFLFYKHTKNPTTKHPEKTKYVQFRDKLTKLDSEFARMFLKTHGIRHAVISKIIIKKGLAEAGAWVGHKCLDTTKKYADELADEKLKDDAYEVMSK
jgi:integrase